MIPTVFGLAPVIPLLTVSLLSLRNHSVSVLSCGCFVRRCFVLIEHSFVAQLGL